MLNTPEGPRSTFSGPTRAQDAPTQSRPPSRQQAHRDALERARKAAADARRTAHALESPSFGHEHATSLFRAVAARRLARCAAEVDEARSLIASSVTDGRQADALALRYCEAMGWAQVADAMGHSVSSVRTFARRGRAAMGL